MSNNNATKQSIILWVHDSFIIVASRGLSVDIFIRVPSFSYNVIVVFVDQRRQLVKFLVLVLVLWIDKRMWCTL